VKKNRAVEIILAMLYRGLGIIVALLFGFAAWTALALGIGSKTCTDDFEWGAATLNYEVATVFLPGLWMSVVFVAAVIAYVGASRIRYFRNPVVRCIAAPLILGLIFGLAVIFTHKTGRCPDF
jgi:hypothetical protein